MNKCRLGAHFYYADNLWEHTYHAGKVVFGRLVNQLALNGCYQSALAVVSQVPAIGPAPDRANATDKMQAVLRCVKYVGGQQIKSYYSPQARSC